MEVIDQQRIQTWSGSEITPLSSHLEQWQKVLSKCSLIPVAYSLSEIEYQKACFSENYEIQDLSQVFHYGEQPVAIFPLVVRKSKDGAFTLSSHSNPVLNPLFVGGLGDKVMKAVSEAALQLCQKVASHFSIAAYTIRHRLDLPGSDLFYRKTIEQATSTSLCHEMKVDLQQDLANLKANIRSSYKSLISEGLKTWDCQIHEDGNIFAEFQNLHQQVAGRVTRPQKTWDLQKAAVDAEQGFLISLRDTEKKLVGCALFFHTNSEAQYAVAAYNRTLFDKPLGHAVQWRAIEHMKSKHIQNYSLGFRPYPSDIPTPSEKEASIAKFKEGFMSSLEIRPVTHMRAQP